MDADGRRCFARAARPTFLKRKRRRTDLRSARRGKRPSYLRPSASICGQTIFIRVHLCPSVVEPVSVAVTPRWVYPWFQFGSGCAAPGPSVVLLLPYLVPNSSAMKKLNIGLIGYGFMGRTHSNAFHKVNHFFDLDYQPVLKA